MPAKRRYKRKINKKPPQLGTIIRIFVLIIFLLTLPVAYYLMTQPQDVRQQAAGGCQEEDVNTEFRPYVAGTDKPWKSGNKMNVAVGDKIDVNCFAKTGSALLSNGKITLTVDGVATVIPNSSIINQGKSLRAFPIDSGGVYKFTCSNSSCSDSDQINVPKDETEPPVVGCTEDARQCPDGSFVSRIAPDCKFATCPGTESCTRNDDGEIQCPSYSQSLLNCGDGGKQVAGPIDECGCQQPPTCENPDISCSNPSVADLNKDCLVDLKDYDLFLSEFIKGQR